jgi:hypothetical protein
MPKQPIFYLLRPQRLAQKGILPEIDLRTSEIMRRTVALQRNTGTAYSAAMKASNSSSVLAFLCRKIKLAGGLQRSKYRRMVEAPPMFSTSRRKNVHADFADAFAPQE